MSTATRHRPTAASIARARWCVRPARDWDAARVVHLVDLTQGGNRGGHSRSLCGRSARTWRGVSDDKRDELETCTDCADIDATSRYQTTPPSGPPPAPGPRLPERWANAPGAGAPALTGVVPDQPFGPGQGRPSAPLHDPIARTPALPAEANTAAARVARRVAFRDSFAATAPPYVDGGPDRRPLSWLAPPEPTT